MHQVLFGVKRVYLLGLKMSRELLGTRARYRSMTPARFDMLRIVHVHDVEGVGVPQGNICLLLGVSGATVSRMLKALEEWGYVVRERCHYMRGLIVRLTQHGREQMQSYMEDLIDNREIDTCLDDLLEPFGDVVLPAFDKLLVRFRDAYQDPAPFEHPWRCGQLDRGWPARFFNPPVYPFAPREETAQKRSRRARHAAL